MARPARASAPLRVALLGLGTVGREVARALVDRGGDLAAAAGGRPVRLAGVGVRDPARRRGLSLPPEVRTTDDLAGLVTDREVDVVVELLGGLEPAGELIVAALDAGRAVVTANKALLARQGVALEAHVRRVGGVLRFEAAVGGGIPILGPLGADLAANRWTSIEGIVNGTTNFILTAMDVGERSYPEVLGEAQAAGYAEADPSADVEGRDAADKLAILIRLAFGAWPEVSAIQRLPPALSGAGRPGVTGITPALLAAARRNDLRLKLVARARRGGDGRLEASVLPAALPSDAPLARTDWVENRIELQGEPVGRLAFGGPGAGGPATASAVLGDLLAIARGDGSTWAGLPPAGRLPAGDLGDGLGEAGRWLTADLPGAGGYTDVVTIASLRRQLAGSDLQATFYPILGWA